MLLVLLLRLLLLELRCLFVVLILCIYLAGVLACIQLMIYVLIWCITLIKRVVHLVGIVSKYLLLVTSRCTVSVRWRALPLTIFLISIRQIWQGFILSAASVVTRQPLHLRWPSSIIVVVASAAHWTPSWNAYLLCSGGAPLHTVRRLRLLAFIRVFITAQGGIHSRWFSSVGIRIVCLLMSFFNRRIWHCILYFIVNVVIKFWVLLRPVVFLLTHFHGRLIVHQITVIRVLRQPSVRHLQHIMIVCNGCLQRLSYEIWLWRQHRTVHRSRQRLI